MDALFVAALAVSLSANPAAPTYRTPNFVVTAPTAELAKQIGDAAEIYRMELSQQWTGQVMPRWSRECPIRVRVGQLGAGGKTTFQFERGEVFDWNMDIQGSAERILDSVLPHEINHTVFACYFRQPLPRWADEGAASLIEHESERARLKRIHEQVMGRANKIPLRQLLSMKNYPEDQHQILVLYAEGYSLADYLVQLSSRQHYLKFLTAAMQNGWEPALKQYYGYDKIERLEQDLDRWILAGSPELPERANVLFAQNAAKGPEPVIRGQSPELPIQLGEAASWPNPNPVMTSRSRATLTLPVATVSDEGSNRQPRAALQRP